MDNLKEAYEAFNLIEMPLSWVDTVFNEFSKFKEFPTEYEIFLHDNISLKIKRFCECLDLWFLNDKMTLSYILQRRKILQLREQPSLSSGNSNNNSGGNTEIINMDCNNDDDDDDVGGNEIDVNSSLNIHNNNNNNNDSLDKFTWRTLVAEEMEYKKLVSLFGTLISRYRSHDSDANDFETSLQSAVAYLYLVAIPDSHMYDIFKTVLYSHILSLLDVCCSVVNYKKTKAGPCKRKHQTDDCQQEPTTTTAVVSDYERLIVRLAYQQHESILKGTNLLLSALTLVFQNGDIRYDNDLTELTVISLIKVCSLEDREKVLNDEIITYFSPQSVPCVARNGFIALLEFCRDDRHHPDDDDDGGRPVIIDLVAKEFGLKLMYVEPNHLSTPTNVTSEFKLNIVTFVGMLVSEFGENCYSAIRKMIQILCYVIPDRAELRAKTKSLVIKLLLVSSDRLRRDAFVDILTLNARCDAKVRLFTTDIISDLILECNAIPIQCPWYASFNADRSSTIYSYEFLLATILSACYDVSINVKCKALSCLDKLLDKLVMSSGSGGGPTNSVESEMNGLFRKFMNRHYNKDDAAAIPNSSEIKPIFSTHRYVTGCDDDDDDGVVAATADDNVVVAATITFVPDFRFIMNMLHQCTRQKNAVQRKYALQILTKISVFDVTWMDEIILKELAHACIDNSISLRKCGSKMLTILLFSPSVNELLIKYWVQVVLPLVLEEQIKYRNEFLNESIFRVLFQNITAYEDLRSQISFLPWLVMREIHEQNKYLLLRLVVSEWNRMYPFSNRDIRVISTHIGTPNNDVSAWSLLSCISKLGKINDAKFILDRFETVADNLEHISCNWLMMETMLWSCTTLNKQSQRVLLNWLENSLLTDLMPRRLITSAHDICVRLITHDYSEEIQQIDAYVEWSEPLVTVTENYVLENIDANACGIQNINTLLNRIILLGEIAQVSPKRINPLVADRLQVLLTTESDASVDQNIELLRPITVITLTKYCLFDEIRLQKILPPLKCLLRSKKVLPVTKQNIIIALTDLCTRFTDTIEPYLGCICMCLASPDADLRLTAVESITEKIRETYIKSKPWIVYPLIVAALDEHPGVRYIINSFLLWESKIIIEKYFSGLVCFANNYVPTGVNKLNKTLRSFVTVKDANRRIQLYTTVLEKANLLQRIIVWRKLSSDIIAKFSEGTIPFTSQTLPLLQDTFLILAENESAYHTKINQRKQANLEDDFNEELQAAEGQDEITDAHKATLKISKAEAAREVVTGILKIRNLVNENKNLLCKPYFRYIVELMKNFDENSQEMEPLIGDTSLMQELQIYVLERDSCSQEKEK